ncbi:MAG: hypothetical protein WB810_12195 [Candidatus Cybelea sp.]
MSILSCRRAIMAAAVGGLLTGCAGLTDSISRRVTLLPTARFKTHDHPQRLANSPYGSVAFLNIAQAAGQTVSVSGINNAAEVVGTATTPQDAFIYAPFNSSFGNNGFGEAGFDDLGTLSGKSSSSGTAIGNVAYGSSGAFSISLPFAAGDSGSEAFRWTGTSMVGLFCGCSFDQAYGVDANGDVAGQVAPSGKDEAIIWPGSGGSNIIPPLGSSISAAQAVTPQTSGSGLYAVGFEIANGGTGAESGFLYNSSTNAVTTIPPLSGDTVIVPRALNTGGQLVVGDSRNASHQEHAFEALGCASGGTCSPTLISPLKGGTQAYADSVNDFGFIAGYSQTSGGADHAVLWRPTGKNGNYVATDLDAFAQKPKGWTLNAAIGINNYDEVVGYGTSGGTTQYFLMPLYDHSIDLSDYSVGTKGDPCSKPITSSALNALAQLGYDLFGVEIGMQTGPANCAQQTLSTIQGVPYSSFGYIFLRYDNPSKYSGTEQMTAALKALGAGTVAQLSFIAIDVETSCSLNKKTGKWQHCNWDGPHSPSYQQTRQQIIAQAIAAATPGKPLIIYTTNGGQCSDVKGNCNWTYLTGLMQNSLNCPLWDAKDDSLGDVDWNVSHSVYSAFKPYGMWSTRNGKQYETSDKPQYQDEKQLIKYSGIASLDIDAFSWNFVANDTTCVGGANLLQRSISKRYAIAR